MSSTLMERARGLHEEIERFERLAAKDFHKEATTHKDRLIQNLRVRQYIDAIQDRSGKLIDLYRDEDKSRKEEIGAIAGDNVFSTFYERLKELRDYHRRHPGLEVPNVEEEESAILNAQPKVDFSGEEASGKFLDLHEMHQMYSNAKFGKVGVTYLEFLDSFWKFSEIERQHRMNNSYKSYLNQLKEYLHTFYRKSQPLSCLNDPLLQIEEDFEDKWERGEIEGWEDKGQGASSATCSQVIDLEAFETSEALEAIGAERIKEALVALGLKSGGTLSQRAERLMATKNKPLESLDPKLFAKGKAPSRNKAEAERRAKLSKSVALLELKIQTLMDLLEQTLNETKSNVEKKATSTYEELVADIEDEEEAEPINEDEEDDEEDIIYNPLKLPLGWDGKPIPYWLYKLHGLNQEFKCEICGNYSYWGRRAFERHFKEYRHQHGMRCLGIPNTKIFNEVTKIADAKALWLAVQQRESTHFTQDQDEEFEDKDGNVYKRKTYLDLQRQGLL